MQQAIRSCASRATKPTMASSKPSQNVQPAPDCGRSRRGLLLGMAAGLAGLASNAAKARTAAPLLSDLVIPIVRDMDTNGNGLLELEEIRGAMQRKAGMSVPREVVVSDVMAPVDFNDDADVTVEEFARGMALELEVDERWMRLMERDGQAGISEEELAAGLGDLGERGRGVLPVAFSMADADRDGRLNRAEASKAMALVATGVFGSTYDEFGGL